MPVHLNLIAAACNSSYAIGYQGRLPWDCLPNEFDYFKRMILNCTPLKKNVLIYGAKTFLETSPILDHDKVVCIVISRSLPITFGEENKAIVVKTLDEACAVVEQLQESVNKVWVCGGVPIYEMALASPHFHRLYLTRIMHDYPGDRFFPFIDWTQMTEVTAIDDADVAKDWQVENGIRYRFCVYKRNDA